VVAEVMLYAFSRQLNTFKWACKLSFFPSLNSELVKSKVVTRSM